MSATHLVHIQNTAGLAIASISGILAYSCVEDTVVRFILDLFFRRWRLCPVFGLNPCHRLDYKLAHIETHMATSLNEGQVYNDGCGQTPRIDVGPLPVAPRH